MKWQPFLSALLNASAAVCLLIGFFYIRHKNQIAHKKTMLSAVALSTLFLINYLSYHFVHGSQKYQGIGPIRTFYLSLLLSHTLLAIAVVPLVCFTLRWAFTSQLEKHKRLARYTLAIWFYVSVTGVLIYLMLYVF